MRLDECRERTLAEYIYNVFQHFHSGFETTPICPSQAWLAAPAARLRQTEWHPPSGLPSGRWSASVSDPSSRLVWTCCSSSTCSRPGSFSQHFSPSRSSTGETHSTHMETTDVIRAVFPCQLSLVSGTGMLFLRGAKHFDMTLSLSILPHVRFRMKSVYAHVMSFSCVPAPDELPDELPNLPPGSFCCVVSSVSCFCFHAHLPLFLTHWSFLILSTFCAHFQNCLLKSDAAKPNQTTQASACTKMLSLHIR